MRAINIQMKADGRKGSIDIYGTIGQDFWGDGVDPAKFKQELEDLGDIDLLEVRIHSYGGFVSEGMAIITALKRHKAEKHIFVDGIAASMASVILASGDKRYIAKNATIMIHDPFTFCVGNASAMLDCAENLEQAKEQLLDIYEEKAKVSRDEISKLMTDETRMTATQALERGFVDEIGIEVTQDEDSAANHENYFNFGIAAHAELSKIAPFLNLEAFNSNPVKPENEEATTMSEKKNAPAATGDDEMVNKASAEANQAQAVTAATEESAKAERARVQGILDLSQPGVEDLCRELAFDGETSIEAAGLKVANKLKELGASNLDNKRNNANAPVGSEADQFDVTDNSPDALEAKWKANEGNCQEEFLQIEDFKAFHQANSEGRVKMLTSNKGD